MRACLSARGPTCVPVFVRACVRACVRASTSVMERADRTFASRLSAISPSACHTCTNRLSRRAERRTAVCARERSGAVRAGGGVPPPLARASCQSAAERRPQPLCRACLAPSAVSCIAASNRATARSQASPRRAHPLAAARRQAATAQTCASCYACDPTPGPNVAVPRARCTEQAFVKTKGGSGEHDT